MRTDKAMEYGEQLTGGMLGKAIDMKKEFKKIGGGIQGSILLGMTGVVAIFGSLFGIAKKFSEVMDKAGETFGVMGAQELGTPLAAARVEALTLGKSVDDLIGITVELSKNFGMSVDEAGRLSNKILDSSVAMGLSNTEGAHYLEH